MSDQISHTAVFTRQNWAWEILRRNPDYIRDWKMNAVNDNSSEAIAAPRKWGLLFFEDPALESTRATPFWIPQISPFVLKATIRRPFCPDQTDLLDIAALACKVTVRAGGRDIQHVLFSEGHKTLQLCCRGDDIRAGRVDIILRMNGLRNFRQNRLLLRRLEGLLHCGVLLDHLYAPCGNADRYAKILRMLSLKRSELPHRKIAEILFARKRIDIEWNDPGSYLRDPVRRALRRGERLLEGKYLDLLR